MEAETQKYALQTGNLKSVNSERTSCRETGQSMLCDLALPVLTANERTAAGPAKVCVFSQATHSYATTVSLLQREYTHKIPTTQ